MGYITGCDSGGVLWYGHSPVVADDEVGWMNQGFRVDVCTTSS